MFANLRYAGRMVRLNPGFAVVAIVTLALGIGATTAMFTVLDGVMLKPLRYPDADRIVAIGSRFTDSGRTIWRSTGGDLEDLRADSAFEAFSFYFGGEMGVQFRHNAEFAGVYLADPNFFRVFSLAPIAGRTFAADDAGRAAVVGASFAQRNFGSASGALGQSVQVEGVAYEIVGVMPAFFDFPKQAQVWAAASPTPSNRNRTSYNYRAVAKLAPGISEQNANARLQATAGRLAAVYPDSNRNKDFPAASLQAQLTAPVRSTLLVLMGAVGLVLLIACANVANLMLARAASLSRELAVRAPLGAGRSHLVTQLLTESMVLALAAGLLGVGLAASGTRILLAASAQFIPAPLLGGIGLDWRVLAFAIGASLATSVLFGVAPAWQSSGVQLQDALRLGGTRGLLGAGSSGLRNALVVAQISLSLMLAIGAGLLFRTVLALQHIELGYRTEGILVAYAHAPAHTLPEALEAGRSFDRLFERLRSLPGVLGSGGAMGLPSGPYGSNGSYGIEGKHAFGGDFRKLPWANFSLASPDYFSTMGIPVLRGRVFNDGDAYDRTAVVVISDSVARQQFPHEDPIGHRITAGLDPQSGKGMTIVGVVGDVRQNSPAEQPSPALYMPLLQHPFHGNEIATVVRTAGNPEALIPAVQKTIQALNPEVAVKFAPMTVVVGDSIGAQRFRTWLASGFAIVALLLALSGMYAVMSYVTELRKSEFGLRSALGAQPGSIVRLVLGGATRVAAAGVAAGIALSLAASRLLGAMLFGVTTTDTTTYLVVTAVILPVIVLAAALPAWRASRVDPLVALRND